MKCTRCCCCCCFVFFCHLTAFRSFYTAIIIIIRRRRRRRITKLTIKTYLQLISLKKKKKNIESKHYLQVISFHMFLFISIKKKFISIKKKRKFITVKKNSFQLITMVIIYFFNNDNNVELDSQLQLAACGLGPSCSNDG